MAKESETIKKILSTLDGVKLIFDKLKEIAKDIPIILGSLGFGGAAVANFMGWELPGMSKSSDVATEELEAYIEEEGSEIDNLPQSYAKKGSSDMYQQRMNSYPEQSTTATVKQDNWINPHVPDSASEWGMRIGIQAIFLIAIVFAVIRFNKKKKKTNDK